MVEHSYSNWFRTFLQNSLKARNEQFKSPICMFNCIMANKGRFINDKYHGDPSKRLDILSVKTSPKVLNYGYLCTGDPVALRVILKDGPKHPDL